MGTGKTRGDAMVHTSAMHSDETHAGAALWGQGLTKRFGDVAAVKAVDLHVDKGEVVALIGPNGAGKSTLLSMLVGLLTPDAGRAVINGVPAMAKGGVARANLGFLSGDTALYGRMTVRELLAFYAKLYGLQPSAIAERVAVVTEQLHLQRFLAQRCGVLSMGQRQRANLARALVHDPQVLVLDEPTTALDVASQEFVLQAVDRARSEGRAVLFSSHIMGEVEAVADRVLLLERGTIAHEGTLDALRAKAEGGKLTNLFRREHDDDTATPHREVQP